MDQHDDLVRAMKARAEELQAQAAATGSKLKRSSALETVAHERGYRNWNAASAAAKSAPARAPKRGIPLWKDLDAELPSTVLRAIYGPSSFFNSIRELMRWARQFELIATKVAQEDRRQMISLIGGSVPYVFVQDQERWSDDLYRLCDRGYEPWPGIAFVREQLEVSGVVEWEAEHGDHGGRDMFSVAWNDVRESSDATTLKRLARLIASIGIVADEAFERQLGMPIPPGIGFTIDLTNPAEVTAANVARLLASRDDSEHRQLRVATDGTAFLSNTIGNLDLDGLAFRFETWVRGNSYVGLAASQDEEWVAKVLSDLKKGWAEGKRGIVD